MLGRRRVSGSGCTGCCWPSCTRPGSSTGRARSRTRVTCKRKRGLANGSQPGRPGPPWQQAAPARRRRRCPACLDTDGRQPQRRHATARSGRPGAAGAWAYRATEAATATAARRPRLRPRQVPATRTAARHQAADRAAPERAWLRPGPRALGCRAHLRLAAQPAPAATAHRSPTRDPRSVPRPRLLPHLLAATRTLIVLEVLRRSAWLETPAGIPLV